MRRPCPPGDPDAHGPVHGGLPGEEVLAGLVGPPPAVALAEIGQAADVARILREPLAGALVVGDGVAVVRQFDLLGVAGVGVVREQDASKVGLGLEGAQALLDRTQFRAEGLGLTFTGVAVRVAQLTFSVLHAL